MIEFNIMYMIIQHYLNFMLVRTVEHDKQKRCNDFEHIQKYKGVLHFVKLL